MYDLDTECGSSGSPVLGRGSEGALYTLKAVHVERVPKTPRNAGQIIEVDQKRKQVGHEGNNSHFKRCEGIDAVRLECGQSLTE